MEKPKFKFKVGQKVRTPNFDFTFGTILKRKMSSDGEEYYIKWIGGIKDWYNRKDDRLMFLKKRKR